MAANYLQRVASAGARTSGQSAAPALTSPPAMPTPLPSAGLAPWRGTVGAEQGEPWLSADIEQTQGEQYDWSTAAGPSYQAGGEPLAVGEPPAIDEPPVRHPATDPQTPAMAADPPAAALSSSPANQVVSRPETERIIRAPSGLRPGRRAAPDPAASGPPPQSAAGEDPASAPPRKEVRPAPPGPQSGRVIIAPPGLRPALPPRPGGVAHLAAPSPPASIAEPSSGQPVAQQQQPRLPPGPGRAFEAVAIGAAPRLPEVRILAARDHGRLPPEQPAGVAAPQSSAAPQGSLRSGGLAPLAANSVAAPPSASHQPSPTPRQMPVATPDLAAPSRAESRISIGRVEVQVNSTPPAPLAPIRTGSPAAPRSGPLLFTAQYFDRFTLRR